MATEVAIRSGRPGDLVAAMRLLDGALLDTDAARVRERLDDGDVLIAVDDETPVGVAVFERPSTSSPTASSTVDADPDATAHLAAIAVRRSRRGRGIGTALVAAGADRYGRLTADCDDRVRPFYESLGFDLERDDGRLRGVLTAVPRRDGERSR
ncbi:GNAT family N-acetyltransferase [Haloferacaceae archaeon DSL9]